MNSHTFFSKDLTEEQRLWGQQMAERRMAELTNVCVLYNPDCGCKVDQFVVLDRFPMSPKIISRCPLCEKGCLLEISDPPIFHTQIGGDFTLASLRKSEITDTWQKNFLELYQAKAHFNAAGIEFP